MILWCEERPTSDAVTFVPPQRLLTKVRWSHRRADHAARHCVIVATEVFSDATTSDGNGTPLHSPV